MKTLSRTFKLKICEELLTWAQLLFKIRIMNLVDDIILINIRCIDKKAMFDVFMLT